MRTPMRATCLLLSVGALAVASAEVQQDPYRWLEEVQGDRALAWAQEHSQATATELEARPEFASLRDQIRRYLDSSEPMDTFTLMGETLYAFVQDQDHTRGIWRRIRAVDYAGGSSQWETVLDLDSLSRAEGIGWVWGWADQCLPPAYRQCMVKLWREGDDSLVQREFDLRTRTFVVDSLDVWWMTPTVRWRDENTLWIGTDMQDDPVNGRPIPRIIRSWKRGTPLEQAEIVLEANAGDYSNMATTFHTPEGRVDMAVRAPSFSTMESYLLRDGTSTKLALPLDMEFPSVFRMQLVFSLNADWTVGERTYRQGSLVAVDLDQLARAGGDVSVLYEPGERGGLQSVSATRNLLLVNTLENMAGRLYEYRFERGVWTRSEVPVPPNSTVTVAAADSWQADDYYITCTDFLHPTALQLVRQGIPRPVRSLSARFSTEGLEVSQHEALSADGTRIPYTVVGRRDIPHDGSTPTVLYGYGGFGWSELPRYDPVLGMAWLERGGVYVIAHTRGGGEFGARWYQAAAGRNRHRACEDFIAVAEDLVRRGITSSAHLGCWGMSNGGWLVGMAFTQRPELFGAVVAEHPPLDLSLGYAGASESGSPSDSVDWSYLRSCSPYHSLARDRVYPRPLLITGTLDATVSPGHARKMAAQMLEYGASVCFYEHPEAGHGAVDNQQRAYLDALIYTYLWQQLR